MQSSLIIIFMPFKNLYQQLLLSGVFITAIFILIISLNALTSKAEFGNTAAAARAYLHRS